MMTSRERLRRAYCHEEMDRPGIYTRTNYPDNDASYDALKAYMAAYSDLKAVWGAETLVAPAPTSRYVEPYSDDFERAVTVVHTPAGDLRSVCMVGRKGQPGYHESYLLATREDAEKYLSLPLPAIGGETAAFFAADARIGDRGIVDVSLGHNPAGNVANLFGSEVFAMMTITDRDILHALCERYLQIKLALVRYLLEQGVGPFFSLAGEEFLVPPLHGKQDFDDFNVRYDTPIVDLIHNGGGRVHIHSHGSIKKVFQGFLDIGMDVLHPFEAPPMGDITPAEARALAGDRVCLEGNIQIHRMYEATPAEVREETSALIATVFINQTGLIVTPTASPFIYGEGQTCLPQYQAMVDTVLGWQ